MFLYLVRLRAAWKSLFLFGQDSGNLNNDPAGLIINQHVHLKHCQWVLHHASNKVRYPLTNCEWLKSEENVQRELVAASLDGLAEVVCSSCDWVCVTDLHVCHSYYFSYQSIKQLILSNPFWLIFINFSFVNSICIYKVISNIRFDSCYFSNINPLKLLN